MAVLDDILGPMAANSPPSAPKGLLDDILGPAPMRPRALQSSSNPNDPPETWSNDYLNLPGAPGVANWDARQAELKRRMGAATQQEQAQDAKRSGWEKAADTAIGLGSMAAGAMGVEGGLSGVTQRLGFPQTAQSIAKSEEDFAKHNPELMWLADKASWMEPTMGGMAETAGALGRPALAQFRNGGVPIPETPVPTPSPTVQSLAAQKAEAAARDLRGAEQLGISPYGPAFQQGPMATVAKQLSETPVIGWPLHTKLEASLEDTRAAAHRIADEISPVATYDNLGNTLQQGLERFRTARVGDLEPGVLRDQGIDPYAPTQPQALMSQRAADRVAQRDAIAPLDQATAQTARGVDVPAARPLGDTFAARRTAEDLSDAELQTIARMPAQDTSFAARQEALYEQARRALPNLTAENGRADPGLFRAVNTDNTFRQIAGNEATAGIRGGIVDGRFGGMADRLRTNVTLDTLQSMRTEVGRALGRMDAYDTRLDRTQLNQIYAALSRDIEVAYMDRANRAHIRSQLPPTSPAYVPPQAARQADQALYALRRADRYTRMGFARMDRFMSVLDAQKPEAAAQRLLQAAQAGPKGNIGLLQTAHAALRLEEWNDVSALLLRELGRPTNSARGMAKDLNFSVQSAATRWDAMDPRARQMIFGGEQAANISALMNYTRRMANFEALSNTSRSATNLINVGFAADMARHFLAGDFVTPLAELSSGMTASGIMATNAYAKWAVGYARFRAQFYGGLAEALNKFGSDMATRPLTTPGRVVGQGLAGMARQVQALGSLTRQHPELVPIYGAATQDLRNAQERIIQTRSRRPTALTH